MKKLLLRIAQPACLLVFLLAALSCGGGGDLSQYSSLVVSLEADSTTNVEPGQIVSITATVTNDGKPAWGQKVAFSVQTPNGGSLSPQERETDGNGKAQTLYTASSNSVDIIQATLSNGAVATVTITKTGSARISSLAASPTTVVEGEPSIITAKVTSDGSNPRSGVAVTFTLPVNASGAGFVNASGATVSTVSVATDASGNAVATYRAGGVSPAVDVFDTVQAALANGSMYSVVIIRKSGTIPSGATVALSASPTTVKGGQTSVITATVTGGTSSGENEIVTLTLPVNNSGASFLNAAGTGVSTVTIRTGSGGTASAIYKAGTINSGTAVQDTVMGVLSNGALNAVTITRSSETIPAGAVITTLSASPTAVNGGQTSVITARVTGGTGSGENEVVILTIPVNNSGAGFLNAAGVSVSSVAIVTGSGGTASAIYRAGANNSGTSIQDTVMAVLYNGALNAVAITVNAGATRYALTVTANPSTIVVPFGAHTGVSLITANIRDNNGTAYVGASVSFTVSFGAGVGNATMTSPATTDGNGNAVSNYTSAHSAATSDIVTASATIGSVIYTGAVVITVP
jgi:hypothetical protein